MTDAQGATGSIARLSARDTAELLHAEVGYLLDRVGIPVLHIKGPTVATWLYEAGERAWGDVDVWVPPDLVDDALAELARHGFTTRFPGVDHRTTRDHAVVLSRPPGHPGGGEVDLHHRFPGITTEPADAFDALWARRVDTKLAHTAVWFPDTTTRALLVALNAARSPGSDQARSDVDRAAQAEVDWSDVAELAATLGAGAAVHAGLALTAAGATLLERHPTLAAPMTPEWRLRVDGAPLTSLRLSELAAAPLRDRPRLVAHWLLPHPAVIRMRDPRAGRSRAALAGAYARRWAQGLRGAPAALRQVRAARRLT